jgi:hypothetical protein
MYARSLVIVLALVGSSGCGTGTTTSVPQRAAAPSAQIRHPQTLSGNGGGHFKLVVGVKHLAGGECMAGADQWYLPNSTFVTLDGGHTPAFYALSTLTLSDTSPVTFTVSEPGTASAYLGISSSSSSYVAAGSLSGDTWTPPSAGTYYAGFVQEWEVNDTCDQYTEYDGTLSLSWTQ